MAFLDKKVKISSLCNYEQAHSFGLRLLSFLQSDLDVLLLLESQYDTTSLLLELQKASRPILANYDYGPDAEHNNTSVDENEFDELKDLKGLE